jgi:hypothetical protein
MWGLHKALVVYMTRREFITLLGGAAATSTLPLAAHACKRQKSSAAIAILRCVWPLRVNRYRPFAAKLDAKSALTRKPT